MADLIIHNANILTQDHKHPLAEAFAVADGKISAVGNNESILPLQQANTKLIDVKSRTVLPGFIDAHIHIWKVGNLKTFLLDLRGVSSIEEMKDKLSDFIRHYPGAEWVQARGINEISLKEKRLPTKEDLDMITGDKPLWVIRTCAHIGIANSKAIELSKLNADTQVPAGGEMRLGNDGKPNGIFTETALGMIVNNIPAYSNDDYALMIKAAEDELLSYGITAATDPAVMPDLLECYHQLERANKLRIRVHALPIRVPDGSESILPLPGKFHSNKLNVNTVKFFADGGLSGMTAAMNKPYKNSGSTGVLRLTEDFFYPIAEEAAAENFGIATHAIGDKAIDVVLRVYKKLRAQSKNIVLRVEHLGLPSANHLQMMRELDVHCVSQSIFLKELGKNFAQYLEDERLHSIYPYKKVLESKINLALSSDAPVVKDFNPVTGIKAAMFRKDTDANIIGADERISLNDALHGYTLAAAKANGSRGLNGSIETGKQADFIILNKKLESNIAEDENIYVTSTYVDGQEVYKQGH